jgi:drug/metabolite transporter (DMT)-like permease
VPSREVEVSQRAKVVIAMLTLYVVWGTTYLAIKVGLDADLPPALFAGLRLLPAGLILFAIAKARGASLKIRGGYLRIVAIVGVLLLVGGQYGTFVAEQFVPSGLSALIVAVLPLWIALAESAFPDMHRPGLMGWLGLGVGFTGLAILLLPRLTGVTAGPREFLGVAIQILATWLWAAGSIYSKRHPVKADGMVITAYQMLIAGGVTIAIGTVLGEWSRLDLTPKGAAALAYLTIFGSCIAFSAFIYALAHLPASKVMTYAYVNPVIAVFAGWAAGSIGLVPAEPVNGSVIVGMVVIIAGVALTTAAPTLPPRRVALSAQDNARAVEALVEPEPSEI